MKVKHKMLEKEDNFSLFLSIVSFNIDALGPMMPKHSNTITEEGNILVHQRLLHSTYGHIIVSKITTTQVGFELRKYKKDKRS